MRATDENIRHFKRLQTLTTKALLVLASVALMVGSCSKTPSDPSEAEAGEADQQVRVDPAIVDWLKMKCLPFEIPKVESGIADLAYLRDLVGGARVVSLGEATHGTKEFAQIKHRVLEYLVDEMGFNTFAIEAGWAESNLLNDCVMTGQGDPARLLAGLGYWMWNTQELLDMILWMRRHNENPGSAPMVGFFGFDMQTPAMALGNVLAYLNKVDPATASWAYSLYAPFLPYRYPTGAYAGAPDNVKTTCRRYISQVYDFIASHKLEYESRSSEKEYAQALQGARIVVQAEAVLSSTGQGNRDYFMAENARWLLDQAGPGGKMVLWAHNSHVSIRDLRMGNYLRSWYGDQMVVFGFAFYRGSFNAVTRHGGIASGEPHPFQVDNPPGDSYEYVFRGSNIPKFFLDLRDPSSPPSIGSWILEPREIRLVGWYYDDLYPRYFFYTTQLLKEYDVVVYFQETLPSTLLPF